MLPFCINMTTHLHISSSCYKTKGKSVSFRDLQLNSIVFEHHFLRWKLVMYICFNTLFKPAQDRFFKMSFLLMFFNLTVYAFTTINGRQEKIKWMNAVNIDCHNISFVWCCNKEILVVKSMLLYFSCKLRDVQLKALVGLLMVELPSPCQGTSLDEKGSVLRY